MNSVRTLRFALTLLRRDGRAGELSLIALALLIAVTAVTAVGFFTDRVGRALNKQYNQLLGADMVVTSDRPLPPEFEREAARLGLATARRMRFPSMVVRGDSNVLCSVDAVTAGYPLRGEMRIADRLNGPDRRVESIPDRGTIWIDERLFTRLGLAVGDYVDLGAGRFRVGAILTREPDSIVGFINAGPRVLLNEADIRATGLVQSGSRVRYRLQIAGSAGALERYRGWARERLQPGQRIEGAGDARPEIRAALDRAGTFLNLSGLVTVVLAAVAIALAARRFLQRHLDGCAVMRCVGASQGVVTRLYLAHFVMLGLAASLAGCLLGFVAQFALAHWLGTFVAVDLPLPGMPPAMRGVACGLALLLGFGLPPLLNVGNVPALRVLRRELGLPRRSGLAGYAAGVALIGGMIFWQARDARLAVYVVSGFAAALLAAAFTVWLLLRLISGVRNKGMSWRFGVANLRRRAWGTITQVMALGAGIMALLTLTLVRGDLLDTWRASLPPEAPNRFVVNIQRDQLEPLAAFFRTRGIAQPAVYPMVRGRLVKIDGRDVSSTDYVDERAKRLIDREFNLSWARAMRADNRIVAGRWWEGNAPSKEQFSMEEGVAATLGIRLGDVLTYDIGGSVVSAAVTSLRKVDWDTFNVNFFVLAPPGMLDGYPASYVTSFYLSGGHAELLNDLVRRFPNIVLIDVAQVLTQVQNMMDQVARAVQFVFLFTLLAGVIVLCSAMANTRDERLYRASILRTLGASRGQLIRANAAEFAIIGALAGLIGAAGANALGSLLAFRILHLAYSFNAGVWAVGVACGAAGVALAGHFATRRALGVPPLKVLREIG